MYSSTLCSPSPPPLLRSVFLLFLAVFFQEFIKRFPKTDHPAAFGQHVNADITSLIEETNALLGTMVRAGGKYSALQIAHTSQKSRVRSIYIVKHVSIAGYENTAKHETVDS